MGKYVFLTAISFLYFVCVSATTNTSECDRVCGKWMSAEKNLIVQVYKDGIDFKAKVVWFDDADDPNRPMDTRTDDKNPDKALRNRKLIGMNVLEGLIYVPKSNSWENGQIYDAKSGRKWSSSAYISDNGDLKVTGYWHYKFIGKTMTFTRVNG